MKRIQIFKASVVALAIGGAFASKASTRFIQTRFTLNGTGAPCSVIVHACVGVGANCTEQVGTNLRTFYHANTSGECNQPLQMKP